MAFRLQKFSYVVMVQVLIALVVVMAVIDIRLWVSRSAERQEGRVTSSIRLAPTSGSVQGLEEDGVENCQKLIAVIPKHVPARLYLGCYLYRLRKFDESRAAFEKAAEQARSTSRERALAYTGAGIALFAAADPKGRTEAARQAAKWFNKALAENPACGDALVNLATVTMWAEGRNGIEKAMEILTRAENKDAPPSRDGMARLYNLRSMILLAQNDVAGALSAAQAAAAIAPEWTVAKDTMKAVRARLRNK